MARLFPLSIALALSPCISAAVLPYTQATEPAIIRAGPSFQHYAFDPLKHLAGISPYFDAAGFGLSPDAPYGCNVSTAAYLVRHGAIYANDYDYESVMEPFLSKLQNVTDKSIFSSSSPLSFLQTWASPYTDPDSQIEHLTQVGALEAYTFGQLLSQRYASLIPEPLTTESTLNASLSIYASNTSRCIDTAESFRSGLFALHPDAGEVVLVSEDEDRGADSLAPHESCPGFSGSRGSEQQDTYEKLSTYTKYPVERLNSFLTGGNESGWNFTGDDIVAMQQLCGYETVIRGSSTFCDLFTPVEWLGFEYLNDLMYHFALGYGNQISPALGMPWVAASTELLKSSSANLSNKQNLYVSFTHREEPAFVMTALGLFNDSMHTDNTSPNTTFPLDSINYARQWKTSEILPFLGHVALEKLTCQQPGQEQEAQFVRAIVNSAPRPLPGCDSGPGASCPLGRFESYVQEREQVYGDFNAQCGVMANETEAERLTVYQ